MQSAFEQSHQQDVQRGDRKEAVRKQRDHEMRFENGRFGVGQRARNRKQERQQHGDGGHRQHQCLQPFYFIDEVSGPIDRHRQPHDGGNCIADAQMHRAVGKDRLIQQPRVQRDRHERHDVLRHARVGGSCRAGGCRQPVCAPEIGGERCVQQEGDRIKCGVGHGLYGKCTPADRLPNPSESEVNSDV